MSEPVASQITDSIDALREQLEVAKTRIRALETAVARADERLDAFAATLPGISWETWGRPDQVVVSYISPAVEVWTGIAPERWQTSPGVWLDLVHPDDRQRALDEVIALAQGPDEQGLQEYRWVVQDNRVLWIQVRYTIVRDEVGQAVIWQAFSLDITAQKLAELERDALLADQARLLTRLSTPLIPVSNDIVVMPLIGPVDRARADRVLEVLLAGISQQHTRVAIIDVTGVPAIDAEVVEALLRAARATRLLGVDMLLTGIRAEVAHAFCTHGQNLEGVRTCANLKQGIAQAMHGTSVRRKDRVR